jgi:hypothetical protein
MLARPSANPQITDLYLITQVGAQTFTIETYFYIDWGKGYLDGTLQSLDDEDDLRTHLWTPSWQRFAFAPFPHNFK